MPLKNTYLSFHSTLQMLFSFCMRHIDLGHVTASIVFLTRQCHVSFLSISVLCTMEQTSPLTVTVVQWPQIHSPISKLNHLSSPCPLSIRNMYHCFYVEGNPNSQGKAVLASWMFQNMDGVCSWSRAIYQRFNCPMHATNVYFLGNLDRVSRFKIMFIVIYQKVNKTSVILLVDVQLPYQSLSVCFRMERMLC